MSNIKEKKKLRIKNIRKAQVDYSRMINRKYTRKLLKEAETDSKMNRMRQLYQKISSIRGGYRKHNKF